MRCDAPPRPLRDATAAVAGACVPGTLAPNTASPLLSWDRRTPERLLIGCAVAFQAAEKPGRGEYHVITDKFSDIQRPA